VKNVLTDKAHGVFQGKIEVDRLAQKTDGYQMNQTLLLSPGAERSGSYSRFLLTSDCVLFTDPGMDGCTTPWF